MRIFLVLLLCAGVGATQTPGKLQARWWRQQGLAERLGLSAEQQKRMDDVFQQNRVRLIDLTASVDKEEALMEPLMSADPPDEAKIRARIDSLAQARAELEKANAQMLLGLRLVLTAEQWKRLQQDGGGGPRPRKVKE